MQINDQNVTGLRDQLNKEWVQLYHKLSDKVARLQDFLLDSSKCIVFRGVDCLVVLGRREFRLFVAGYRIVNWNQYVIVTNSLICKRYMKNCEKYGISREFWRDVPLIWSSPQGYLPADLSDDSFIEIVKCMHELTNTYEYEILNISLETIMPTASSITTAKYILISKPT